MTGYVPQLKITVNTRSEGQLYLLHLHVNGKAIATVGMYYAKVAASMMLTKEKYAIVTPMGSNYCLNCHPKFTKMHAHGIRTELEPKVAALVAT